MQPDTPHSRPLNILYRDEHFVAIDKPPGLLVHRTPISRDRVFVLQTLRDQLGQRVYPVHRLDRATSGVLILAFDPASATALAAGFQARTVDKEYLAVARGWTAGKGRIDHPITDDEGSGIAQNAITDFKRLANIELPFAVDRYPSARYSLLRVVPETGRRHQIRKHFKHISHHLIGDTTHGNGKHNRFFRQHLGISRLLLMARTLRFQHPFADHPVTIQAPPSPDWREIERLFERSLF
jgi:tRNA pseudouridine65 synthase